MGQIIDIIQNVFNNGEISEISAGRFDVQKYPNSVGTLENFLNKQLGGVIYRPGTIYAGVTKTSSLRSRLLKFFYSTEQNYAIEAGDEYFRFWTKPSGGSFGQLTSGGNPVELVTVFEIENINTINYSQNADTMYIATGVYPVQKLTRTSATTFTITEVLFKRGPFLDSNITTTTIDPSADTGAGITLTASSAIFLAGHVGSLWRIKDGVVKITAFGSTTSVTATVQDEPEGAVGNLGTGGTPQTDWAEGAFSAVRGYPSKVCFHDGRLWFAKTTYQVGGLWGSVLFQYENHDEGEGDDDDAIRREMAAGGSGVADIRWLSSSPKSLQAGTSAGPFTIDSGDRGIAITPQNVTAKLDTDFGSADIQAKRMFNYVYYVQNSLNRVLESGYFFDVDQNDVRDTMILADHILDVVLDDSRILFPGDNEDNGAYDMDTQQSPNNRLWVVRKDGQISILTRNPREEVNGWCRFRLGKTISCDGRSGHGLAESIVIMPQEGENDLEVIQANRVLDGVETRTIEYFDKEDFKNDFDPIRLDCSLTYNNPITITDITDSIPHVVTAASHGFSTGNQVRLDNIVGKHQLNGTKWIITVLTTDTFELTTEVV